MELENNVGIKSSKEGMNNCKLSEDHQTITERKMSKTNNDLWAHEVEKIIECPICLEVMEEPRQLPCQHAFCYKCLKSSYDSSDFRCPLCRCTVQICVDKLPPALIENQLIDLDNKLRKCTTSFVEENIQDTPLHPASILNQRFTGNTMAKYYKENMYANSRYQLSNQPDEYQIIEALRNFITDNDHIELLFFDINIIEDDHYSIQWVMVFNNDQFIVRSKSQFQIFHVYIEDKIIKPQYIRIYREELTITGQLTKDGQVSLLLLRCNGKGEVLAKSEIYQWPYSMNVQMTCGFDFNENENKYYVCIPEMEQVGVYDFSLTECDEHFHFEGNRPQYVAFSASNNQLWLSCPHNKHILIFDLNRGYYRTINTDAMIPMMIYISENDKIIFMDSKHSILVWVKKLSDEILQQVLSIPLTGDMKLFKTMPTSDIVVSNGREIKFFRNSNDKNTFLKNFKTCYIL